MEASVRELVRQRAGGVCEYCRLSQDDVPLLAFHVEHIVPRKHGGGDDISNLAFARQHCNLHKGPNLTGIDPISGDITPLYHPRRVQWEEHFALRDGMVVGLTTVGRTTVRVLEMDAQDQLDLRSELD